MQEVEGPAQVNYSNTAPPLVEEGMILQLADGTIVACNVTAENLLGLTTEQIFSFNLLPFPWRAIHEDGTDFSSETHPATQALSTGQAQLNVVMGLYHPEGDLIWFTVDAQPLFQATGSTYGVISKFRQISPSQFRQKPSQGKLCSNSPQSPNLNLSGAQCNQSAIASNEAITLFNLSVDMLGIASLEGTFQTINPAFERTLGYSAFDLITQPFLNFVHPDDQVYTTAELEKLNAGATTLSFTNRYRCKNGVYKWLEWTAVPVVHRGTMYVIGRDVTERKCQEAALRENEERWQLTLRGSNDGVWDWNVRTNEVFFSPRWKEMLGYSDYEIENSLDEWSNRVHPDDLKWVMQAVEDHFEGKTPFYISEHRVRCKDGSYKWILDRGKALWDEDGNVVRMAGTHTDISERKALEAALQTANETLEQRVADRTIELQIAYDRLTERETLYRTLAQNIPNGSVVLFDRDLRYLLCEGSELKRLGLDAEAMVGKSIWEVFESQLCEVIEGQYRAALSGQAVTEQVLYQNQVYEAHAVPVWNERNEIYAGMVLTQNVTERTQNEAKRQQAEEALRKSEETARQRLVEIETIYQSAPIGLSILDTDLRFVRINQRLADINGLPIEAHIGHTVRSVLPELADTAEQLLREILETGKPLFNVEIQGETPAQPGVQRTWLEHFLPLKNGDQVIGISIVCEEITKRKAAETALQQSEDRLRMALESAQMGVWDYNLITDTLTWDNQCKRMWGLPPDAEVNYDVFLAGLHPLDRDCTNEIVQQALNPRSGGAYDIEFRTIGIKDGIERWIAAKGQAYFSPTGQPIRFTGTVLDITDAKHREAERQRAQTQLRDQQERLQAALEAAGTGTFRWDIRTNTLDWDGNLDRLFGLPPGQTARSLDAFIQMVYPDDRQAVIEQCQRCASEGTDLDMDFRVVYPDGTIRWLSDKGKTFFDGDGSPAYMTGACIDITERKHTLEALRQSEEFKDRILESSPDCIKLLDLDGRLLYMNSGGMCVMQIDDFTPYRNAEWVCFWQGEGRQQASMALVAALAGEVSIFQGYCPTAKGTPKWWEVIVSPILDGRGQVERVLSISRDITERKQALEALRRSEERYRILFESMEDGFCVVEVLFDANNTPIDYRFLEINPAFEVQTGLKQAEGKTARQLLPNLENHWFEIYGKVALTGEPVRFENGSEVMNRYFEVNAFRVGQPESRKVAILFKEISERKAIEVQREKLLQQEQAAREAAERANRIKDEFLAVLSHELRSPLNPILGWAKILQTGKLNAAKTKEALAIIERNAKLQSQLIEDLLDVSRILRGKLTLNAAPVDMAATIRAALETVRLAAEAKNIELELSLGEVRPIIGDGGRLQQVVWNLLTNAIKFTPEFGRVEVYLTQIESYAQIQVRDTGKGISPEFLPYVFEHFRQEDGAITRKFGGLGLGLAIVRQIVEMHGGTVQADSPGVGLGATFTVTLPLPKQTLCAPTTDSSSVSMAQSAPLAGIRALVVDDDADSRDFIAFVLEQEGAEVVQMPSAIEGLQTLDQSQFDILLSDIGMPEIDGYTFIGLLRKRPVLSGGQIPALALTAYASELDQRQAIAAGFQRHLAKPIDPEELVEAVVSLVTKL